MARSHYPLHWLNIYSRITFACAWHACKHLQMLRVCRHARLHTYPCLCPSSPFFLTHVRVLKLETASIVNRGKLTFLGRAVRGGSSHGGRELLSAHTGLSHWLCKSHIGDLPVCILSDDDVPGKSKFTLASSFSTSITHNEPKPNLSWWKPQKAWLQCHSRGPKPALHAAVPYLTGSAFELRCPAGHH